MVRIKKLKKTEKRTLIFSGSEFFLLISHQDKTICLFR